MKKLYFIVLLCNFYVFSQNSFLPTGNSSEIGNTDGELGVSLSGAANYSLPITMPKGLNGVNPKLFINYNSQSGVGAAGYGWGISGLSTITRIPSTKFHDGIIDCVDGDNFDRFALDGQRLILKSNSSSEYGSNNAIYETENSSNIRITSFTEPNLNGPSFFTVEYPDGSIAKYGGNYQSRTILEWKIVYWQNPQGLKINYYYQSELGFLYIDRIEYGSQNETTHPNKIKFKYKQRTRIESLSFSSYYINKQILDKLEVFSENIGFRNYEFTYDNSSLKYDRLVKISEISGDNLKVLNPTVFNYETSSNQISHNIYSSNLNIPGINFNNSEVVNGDFDGDGMQDFIIYAVTGPFARNKYQIFRNIQDTGVNNGILHDIGNFDALFPVSYLKGNLSQGFKISHKTGWCVVKNNFSNSVTSFRSYELNNGSISQNDNKDYIFPKYNTVTGQLDYSGAISTNLLPIPKRFYSGDFNGDAISDVIAIEVTPNNNNRIYYIDLDKRLSNSFVFQSGEVNALYNSQIFIDDVNGDGKSDLLVFKDFQLNIYSLNELNQFVNIGGITHINITSTSKILIGDYNGDGRSDFIIPINNANSYVKFTSIGSSTIGFEVSNHEYYITNNQNSGEDCPNIYHIIPTDFNKDGKTDLILARNVGCNDGFGFISIRHFANVNNNFESTMYASTDYEFGIGAYAIPLFLSGKNNKYRDEINFITNFRIIKFNSHKDLKSDGLLKSITLGNGTIKKIDYNSLVYSDINNNENIYSPSLSIDFYPNYDIYLSPDYKVVKRLEVVSDGEYKKQDYKYYGAVSNVEGLGFLGFRAISKTNWYNEYYPKITHVSKFDTNRRGALIESYTILGEPIGNFFDYSPTDYISKDFYSYDDELLSNKVYKIKNISEINLNGLNNTSTEITKEFNEYDIVKKVTTLFKNGSNIEKTKINKYDYLDQISPNSIYIGRVSLEEEDINVNTDITSKQKIYSYDLNNNLVTSIKTKGYQTNEVTEEFEYDDFGNLNKSKIFSDGLNIPREESFEYEETGRFLKSYTDSNNLVTNYDFDSSKGLLKSIKLHSSNDYPLITKFEYDSWGKKILETDYLNKNIKFNYSWINSSINGNYKISAIGDDNSFSIEYYNSLGRKIADGSKTINDLANNESNISWKSFEYDIYGRVVKAYEPILSDSPSWTGPCSSTTYDSYGRVIKFTEPTGKITNFNHTGLITIATDGTSNVKSIRDSSGNVTTSIDNGGTITYEYFANGNLKKSNFNGSETIIEQDGWGRKVKLTDSSAGIYLYKYNDIGEILQTVTPKGITDYSYDDYGNIAEEKIIGLGGDTTNLLRKYHYDDNTKDLIKINHNDISNNFNITYDYSYDEYRRLKLNRETTPNNVFQRETKFDQFGRPEIERYYATQLSNSLFSDKWIKNIYKNGYIWQIVDNDTNLKLWENVKVNARGQLLSAKYGNNIVVTNSYDQFGFVMQSKYDKSNTPFDNILTLKNSYNVQMGNLINRYNSSFDFAEEFRYDDVDRLSSWIEKEILNTYSFNTDVEGFISTSSSASVTHQNSPFIKRLIVASNTNMQGVQKLFRQNAIIGEKLRISGNLIIKSASPGTIVKYIIMEKDPVSGLFFEVIKDDVITVNNTFSFEHIVTQYSDVYMKFLVYNDFSSPSMTFYLDEVKVSLSKNGFQTYDNFGRIDDNNVGNYKYIYTNIQTQSPSYFQNSSIDLTPEAGNYYLGRSELNISYNAFKSPVNIIEEGKDKLSFEYNLLNNRSVMYYGGLQDNKYERPLRKYYSSDGSMEVKQNIQNNSIEFITYIAGDAYSTPIILKSDGTTQKYYYLHRDYLGSIVAISNQDGNIVEKRIFDAWGDILKVQDGNGNDLGSLSIIDRGYTGHEHLQGVNLIHMNGRLYDPKVHRFLQPDNFVQDPFNTQNYNRYGYVLNNPLKYIDPTGENGDYPGGEGPINGTQIGLGSAFSSLANVWDDPGFKDFVGRNFNIKNINNGLRDIGNGFKSVENFVTRNIKSLFGIKDDNKNYLPSSPSFSNHKLSNGWQNESNASGLNHAMHQGDNYQDDSEDGDPPAKKGTVYKLSKEQLEAYGKPTEFGMGIFEWVEGGGLIKGGGKVYEVYQLINKETGVVKYVGKTSQGLMKRFNQHLLDPAKKAWINNVEPVLFKGNLTKFEAKYYEQTQIMNKGLDKLYNRINAVAEKYWTKYGIK